LEIPRRVAGVDCVAVRAAVGALLLLLVLLLRVDGLKYG